MADKGLKVSVVSAEREVWKGDATQIMARTLEGELGILGGHEPFLGILAPCAVEIFCADGNREVVAVDGGFISVEAAGRVAVLSEFAQLGKEISLDEAQRELDSVTQELESTPFEEGVRNTDLEGRYERLSAQVRAAQRHEAANSRR